MATEKKMTKRDYYKALLAKYALTDKEKAFIEHEIELLDKKNATEKKPTAQQKENEIIKQTILDVLISADKMMTITDLMKESAELGIHSNQKLSALMRQLKDDGKVEKIEDKRKSYFRAC
jgi:16S rRNA U1498 N3-methylase RsmE